jgi:hypothetical protein
MTDLKTVNFALEKLGKWKGHVGGYKLDVDPTSNRLYFSTLFDRKSVMLQKKCRVLFDFHTIWMGLSGTNELMVVTLIRWLRNEPRHPSWCWDEWAGPGSNACPPDFGDFLRANGYDNDKTLCQLCNKTITKEIGLVWSFIGPLCPECHETNKQY